MDKWSKVTRLQVQMSQLITEHDTLAKSHAELIKMLSNYQAKGTLDEGHFIRCSRDHTWLAPWNRACIDAHAALTKARALMPEK